MNFQAIVAAPFGALGICCDADAIDEIRFLPPGVEPRPPQLPLAITAARQLEDWLESPRARFDLPLRDTGTPFQRRVWQAISSIDSGEVLTYGELAHRLQSSARAVGQACGANPFPVVVPCHRVVARQHLGGFAGHRDGFLIRTKQWLLHHESVRKQP